MGLNIRGTFEENLAYIESLETTLRERIADGTLTSDINFLRDIISAHTYLSNLQIKFADSSNFDRINGYRELFSNTIRHIKIPSSIYQEDWFGRGMYTAGDIADDNITEKSYEEISTADILATLNLRWVKMFGFVVLICCLYVLGVVYNIQGIWWLIFKYGVIFSGFGVAFEIFREVSYTYFSTMGEMYSYNFDKFLGKVQIEVI